MLLDYLNREETGIYKGLFTRKHFSMNGLAGKLSSFNHWIFDIRTILPSVPTGTLEITSYHWSPMYSMLVNLYST